MHRRTFLALAASALATRPVSAAQQEMPVTARMIDTATLRMTIREKGAGPLVLLCHGFPETGHSWRRQIDALAAAGYRAVAPDMRGYGGTEAPEAVDAYTLFHGVGDMVALLHALGEEKAVIVGHDWGATLAWQAALMRPDRFRAVAATGVPMMGQPPVPPTQIFPRDDNHEFYTLYFQEPGRAEPEFERDPAETLRRILYAASGDAGPRRVGDATPSPFGMVSSRDGLLAGLPSPATLPAWLPEADLAVYANAFAASGFRGGLNWYRNLDRNWALQKAFTGMTVNVPALFMIGARDTGLAIPGMAEIIAAMPALVPDLRGALYIQDAGHWLAQERPAEVSTAILSFLATLG